MPSIPSEIDFVWILSTISSLVSLALDSHNQNYRSISSRPRLLCETLTLKFILHHHTLPMIVCLSHARLRVLSHVANIPHRLVFYDILELVFNNEYTLDGVSYVIHCSLVYLFVAIYPFDIASIRCQSITFFRFYISIRYYIHLLVLYYIHSLLYIHLILHPFSMIHALPCLMILLTDLSFSPLIGSYVHISPFKSKYHLVYLVIMYVQED